MTDMTDEGVAPEASSWHFHHLRAHQLPPTPTLTPTTGDVPRLRGAPNPDSTHNPISTHRVWTHQRPVTLHRRANPLK